MYKKLHEKLAEARKKSFERRKLHEEYHMKIRKLYSKNSDFKDYYRHIKFAKPFTLIFELLILYLIFYFFGIKKITFFVASVTVIIGILNFLFLLSLEKRILNPISRLTSAVEKIANGSYNICVEQDQHYTHEIGMLINSFNNMTKQLYEGEKLKTEYETNRKALIANISHDLKTPITSIQAYTEMLLDRKELSKETAKKYYTIIYNNTDYLNKLIDDLFLFSKLDVQKLELNFENIKLKAFMEDLMEEFKLELEDKHIEFYYEDCLKKDYYIKLDSKRICQIIRNIIGNAVKYGDNPNLIIKVRLSGEENSACIEIANNGPIIPEDKLPDIFERFYRVDCARTKNLMSTGLGLSIAKELVEAHNGRISVSSNEEKGTCFKIMLPINSNGDVLFEKNTDY